MLRTLIAGLTVAVMTILLAPVAAVATLLGIGKGNGRVQQGCMRLWARAICFTSGVRIVVHGTEHVDPRRGSVYASNHVSWFDVFTIAAVLPRYTFVAKAELRRIPIFGWGAEGAGVVFLSRENRKSAFEAYHDVAEKVSQGLSVVVCPEGTRGSEYSLRPFKKGPFVLAIAAGAPVVPIVVHGAREVMSRGSWRVRSGTVHVHFLEPVHTSGYDYDHRHDLMRTVWDRMAEMLRREYGVESRGQAVADGAAASAA